MLVIFFYKFGKGKDDKFKVKYNLDLLEYGTPNFKGLVQVVLRSED
jgi:hypothetical protein